MRYSDQLTTWIDLVLADRVHSVDLFGQRLAAIDYRLASCASLATLFPEPNR